ncbi:MAG: hypothetical protein A2234_00625 [Elusimicrobia bacterium RIFOXYA2_FULL_58_8]|nr:MAG: hypothetical protein A2285_06525 [Elusimicrobia bacterium RIFOXYA12_FULL_57_11]OGS12717.1 MAG: hypothetical protein A2234_00625 [Elusimicrobia bacterium RIFOXYA2_FULL_58_8]
MKNRTILAIIIFCAALLRLSQLGDIPFWEDELYTLYRSKMPLVSAMYNLIRVPTHPPLYYFLVNLWVGLFGDSEIALRLPSVIFSTASVFYIFKLGEKLYSPRSGLYAAALAAIFPFSLYYAQEAKMYSLSWLLCLASFLLFYRLLENFSKTGLTAYILLTTASWYTSYTVIICTLVQFLTLFLLKPSPAWKKWFWAYFLILLLYFPWLGIVAGQSLSWECIQWVPPTDNYLLQTAKHISGILNFPPWGTPGKWIAAPLTVLYLLMAAGAIAGLKKDGSFPFRVNIKTADTILLAWLCLPFAAYYLIDKFWFRIFSLPRYIGFVHIPLLLLAGKGICKLTARQQAAALVILCLTSSAGINAYYSGGRKILDQRWEEALAFIESSSPRKSLVITAIDPAALACYKTSLTLRPGVLPQSLIDSAKGQRSFFVILRDEQSIPAIVSGHHLRNQWKKGSLHILRYE